MSLVTNTLVLLSNDLNSELKSSQSTNWSVCRFHLCCFGCIVGGCICLLLVQLYAFLLTIGWCLAAYCVNSFVFAVSDQEPLDGQAPVALGLKIGYVCSSSRSFSNCAPEINHSYAPLVIFAPPLLTRERLASLFCNTESSVGLIA
jgi:hypothetical protein